MSDKKSIKTVRFYLQPLRFLELVKNPIPRFTEELRANDGLVKIQLVTSRSGFMTDRPELIRQVLQRNNKKYIKSEFVRKNLGNHIGQGLLTADGEYWLRQRRSIQPGFHRKRLAAIADNMVTEINSFLDLYIEPLAKSGQESNLHDLMTHLTFNIITKALFGQGMTNEQTKLIDDTVNSVQDHLVKEIRQPYLIPWMKINGQTRQTKAIVKKANELITQTIQERRISGVKHDDLLDMLLETRYEDTGGGMTDKQIREEAIILHVAGHETTANAMTWAFYLLHQYPNIEEQLLGSIRTTLEEKAPSFEDTRKLTYSMQIIEEVMRMYPPAWLIDREALIDDELDGYPIKKGEDVILLIHAVHHNPKYWDNPEEFNPDRFSPENKKKITPYSYLPFGGGPRLCIGNNFALMEMQFILAQLLRRYKVEVSPNQDIKLKPQVTLQPKDGIMVKFRKR